MTSVQQALQVMAIGLPVMFGVILIFIGVIKLLFVIFPDKDEEQS
ncbi:MAG TPA: hypothetical protein VN441_09765 [Syntrophomonas sp.]|nr:hypothetical protein [Syntrophomonas sp.]